MNFNYSSNQPPQQPQPQQYGLYGFNAQPHPGATISTTNGMYVHPQPFAQPQMYIQPQPQTYVQPTCNYSCGISHQPQMSSGGSLAQQILAACRNSSFDSDKVKAVQNCSTSLCSPVSANDLVSILHFFGMDNDKVKVLNQLKQTNNIALMTGSEAASIIRTFNFDNDRIRALDAIVNSIYDRKQNQSEEAVVAAFGFSDDINRARNLMQTR